jgi:aspartate 1-decarboxylase
MQLRQVLCAKLHHLTITEANVDYVGSITIDQDLMDKVGMVAGEFVHVWNGTNGERLQTYTIAGERGSGVVCMNGPAALRCQVGHRVIVAAFALTDNPAEVKPMVGFVDAQNRFTGYGGAYSGGTENATQSLGDSADLSRLLPAPAFTTLTAEEAQVAHSPLIAGNGRH